MLTGALYNDILAEYLKSSITKKIELCDEFGLVSNKMLIVSALPADSFHAVRGQVDFNNYSKLVEFWVKTLASLPNCNIIIRLHPRLVYEEMKYIEQWGVKICQWDTARLIPLCDLFVASVSATIRWAITCGKPVINYDVYRFRYSDYNTVDGVIRIEEQNEFKEMLSQLVIDKSYYSKMVQRQKKCMNEWGDLDGKAGSNILQVIENLTMSKSKEN